MKNLTKLKLSKYAFMSAPRNDVYLIFSGRSGKNIRLSCKSFDAIKHNRLDTISDDTLYLLRVVCFVCIQVQNVLPSSAHPFCWHADKM